MARTTTIRLDTSVKKRLESFKNFDRESYEDVIRRMINISQDSDKLDADEIRQLESSIADLKKGRVLSWSDAKKKWGI